MIIKLKYVGTTGGGLTQNNVYIVLALNPSDNKAHILDDNNDWHKIADYTESELWTLESVETVGNVVIYQA